MLEQTDGYLPLILKKMGKNIEQIKAETIVLLDKLPRIQGTNQIGLSSELNRILEQSEREMKELWDAYITTEHFLLTILKNDNKIKQLLEKLNITYQIAHETILQMRNKSKQMIQKSVLKLFLNMEKILRFLQKKGNLILSLEETKN